MRDKRSWFNPRLIIAERRAYSFYKKLSTYDVYADVANAQLPRVHSSDVS